jgi:hypothetical protein
LTCPVWLSKYSGQSIKDPLTAGLIQIFPYPVYLREKTFFSLPA